MALQSSGVNPLTSNNQMPGQNASHDSLTVLDADAILQLELSGTRLIEASAGTGKTHTIATSTCATSSTVV